MDLLLSWIEWFLFPHGAHLILVTVVLFYASPGPSNSVPHWARKALVTLIHPGIIGTGILYSTPGLLSDQGPMVPFLASN